MKFTDQQLIEGLQNLFEELGRTPRMKDVKNCDYLPYVEYIKRRFGSWNGALKAAGLEPNYHTDCTKRQIIRDLQIYASQLGRTLTIRDLKKCKYLPSPSTVVFIFGSWNNAKEAAGLK